MVDPTSILWRGTLGVLVGAVAVLLADRGASVRATALGLLAAIPPSCVPLGVRPWSGEPVLAGLFVILVVAGPVGALHGMQLVAALAGRGRPAPFPGADPWVRGVIAAPLLVFSTLAVYDQFASSDSRTIGPLLGVVAVAVASGALACASVVGGRARGASLIVPLLLGWVAQSTVASPLGSASAWFGLSTFAGAPLVTLAAMRLLAIGRRELAALGVTAWAPGDIAVVPPTAALVLIYVFESRLRDALGGAGAAEGTYWIAPLVLAAAQGGALWVLRRRLARVELARELRRASAQPPCAPPAPVGG